jgi:hypothetical protein
MSEPSTVSLLYKRWSSSCISLDGGEVIVNIYVWSYLKRVVSWHCKRRSNKQLPQWTTRLIAFVNHLRFWSEVKSKSLKSYICYIEINSLMLFHPNTQENEYLLHQQSYVQHWLAFCFHRWCILQSSHGHAELVSAEHEHKEINKVRICLEYIIGYFYNILETICNLDCIIFIIITNLRV